MYIDLNFNNVYNIDEKVIIPRSYYENSEVKDIKEVNVVGKLYYDSEDNIYIDIKADGVMILADSITLDDIEYPFSIEYNDLLPENLKNSEEKLDLFEFLWENIVLEVPIKFTNVTDFSEFQGNGWKLTTEEEEKINNNPFGELLKDFDKKE